MNLSVLRSQTKDHLAIPVTASDTPFVQDSFINDCVNGAVDEVSSLVSAYSKEYYDTVSSFPLTFPLTNPIIQWPTDFGAVVTIFRISGNERIELIKASYPEAYALPTGVAIYYYVATGQGFELFFVPTAAQTINFEMLYKRTVQSLVKDEDIPDIPNQVHSYIPHIAARIAMNRMNKPNPWLEKAAMNAVKMVGITLSRMFPLEEYHVDRFREERLVTA